MDKMSIRVFLKSGAEFTIKCDKFVVKKNGLGAVTGLEWEGATENAPVHINFEQVAAVVRVYSDELEGEE